MAELSKEEIVRNLLSDKNLLNEDVVSGVKIRRFRSFLLDITDTHFTYQGLWIIFSIFFLSKQGLQKFKLKKYKGLLLFGIAIILVGWLFLISSRMPIIAMVIAAFYVMFVLGRITIKSQLLLLLVTLLCLNISYFVFTTFRVRVNEIFKNKFEFPTETKNSYSYTSVNVRNGIYSCVLSLAKENLIFGVGVGDSQDELNKCYTNKIGAKIYTWKDYNTHNQYFFFLVASGLIGVVLFLALLYLHWKTATNRSNQIYLYFITIICLISLTENILSRSDGVMFFAFFSGLFLFNIKELNDNN
ncbi:O-antigen ligase family protein [Gaetbulibacter sp. M235]|uniref:O-antigen ligase family protein n=1 Tax=Gaetbulibacter sp. M235 TaxID=3126510 RepID=UPI00374F0C5A